MLEIDGGFCSEFPSSENQETNIFKYATCRVEKNKAHSFEESFWAKQAEGQTHGLEAQFTICLGESELLLRTQAIELNINRALLTCHDLHQHNHSTSMLCISYFYLESRVDRRCVFLLKLFCGSIHTATDQESKSPRLEPRAGYKNLERFTPGDRLLPTRPHLLRIAHPPK